MTLPNMDVISRLNINLFSMIQAIKTGFQVVSETESPILEKKSTEIPFDKKITNTGDGRFF